MAPGADQLVIRQHERLTCRLAATLRVADEHARQVALARSSGDGAGTLVVTAVDCSRGGLGLDSPLFLPRSCRVRIRIAPESAAGAVPFQPVEFTARVQRIAMTTRTPTYYVGLAFIPEGNDHTQKVEKLMTFVRASAHRAAPAPVAPAPNASSPPSTLAPSTAGRAG